VPLSKATEQRDNFVDVAKDVCPALKLLQRIPGCVMTDVEGSQKRWNRGLGRFRYSERDESGHEWYTFEECRVPGPEQIVYDPDHYVRGDSIEMAASRAAAARAMGWTPPQPTAVPVVA